MTARSLQPRRVTPGHFSHAVDGALVRKYGPRGNRNGMRCADFADAASEGSSTDLFAYTELLGQPPFPKRLPMVRRGLGDPGGYHKIHACCQSTHSAVEAMLTAVERMGSRRSAKDVERIVLETHRPGMSNRKPATTLAAKFSFEHTLATAQIHGHAEAEAFSAETLAHPDIARRASGSRSNPTRRCRHA